jgi:hypothetical protein
MIKKINDARFKVNYSNVIFLPPRFNSRRSYAPLLMFNRKQLLMNNMVLARKELFFKLNNNNGYKKGGR